MAALQGDDMTHATATAAVTVSPVQLLSMMLGYLDADRQYSADAGTWAEALLQMRDRFEATYPDLYGGFGFRSAPHAKPYSRDVSEFLTHMQLGLAVGVGNPEFKVLQIKRDSQKDLLDAYERDPRYERALDAARQLAAALLESHAIEVATTATE